MSRFPNTHIIFVAGFPRSGTTWFSNLINSHSKVIYRHELIGRNYSMFGENIFHSLKYNNGLTDQQYLSAMSVILDADIDTDKPPFFKKDMGLSQIPKLHHVMWLCAKLVPIFRPVYSKLFRVPSGSEDFKVLLKETRSTTDMKSMLTGLRIKNKLFLVRAPQGCIASHVTGIKKGKMECPDKQAIKKWFAINSENEYIRSLNITSEYFESITTIEFLAISWRLYHLELFEIILLFPDSIVCFYEDFVESTVEQTKQLFKKIKLEYSASVEKFILQSSDSQTNQAIFKDSNSDFYSVYRSASFKVDSWRDSLTSDEIELINLHTMDVYDKLKLKG
jgi:hypothetical protein